MVAEATSGREAVELAAFYHPDAVVMDVKLPVIDGVEATRMIHERSPGDLHRAARERAPTTARAAGAARRRVGLPVQGRRARRAAARAARRASSGEAAISRRLAMTLIESYRRAPRGGSGLRPVRSELTDREWEVLDLLAAGAGTEDIARTLVLSTETVRSHLKNLYRKLGVRSRERRPRRPAGCASSSSEL